MTDAPPDEAALTARVDRSPDAHRATEPDEDAVLAALYGPGA
ncbi:hypothetical protein BTM25_50910 [Actinomadura rubteroloni]|uniref:Uncharacterized protein n=1 Tax=Actinomadura rubteroloni TaxID=1926885 RepID=A0A2P4UCV5_9ACTN|nr:hypothetical protein [Actinomadura rubteroloni]POM22885.1 hypothetical protein BTM25_50910 [Actinomadura rubteroloni]